MTADVTALALANVAYLLLGAGIFAATGVVDREPATWPRLGAAYLVGVAVVVVPATYLALLGVAIGWTAIAAACALSLAAGALRLRRGTPTDPPRFRLTASRLLAIALVVTALLLLAYAARSIAVKPLLESDGWTVWAVKARVLYDLPGDAPGLLRSEVYGPPSYPIGMPVLEALAFRALGRFDGAFADLQLLALAAGFVGAILAVTRGVARGWLVALALLAAVSAPQFLIQLSTNYVDVPLAVFVAAAVTAAGSWLLHEPPRPTWLLAMFVTCAGMAGLLKNEGLLFVLAALVSLVAASATIGKGALRQAIAASAGALVIVLPWRLYAQASGLRPADYDLTNLVDIRYLHAHAGRVWPVVTELAAELTDIGRWGPVAVATLVALTAAALGRRWLIAGFVAAWLGLSFTGLVATYWISVLPLESDLSNSSYRTIVSLLVTGLCVVPLLVGPLLDEWRSARAADRTDDVV